FFQAEDGIRDRNVTGVQTCALPIYNCGVREPLHASSPRSEELHQVRFGDDARDVALLRDQDRVVVPQEARRELDGRLRVDLGKEIGRASCRERGEDWEVDGSGERKG